MPAFTNDQWLIVLLVFLLGLVIGAALMAGGKWKGRYRAETARRQELEAENAKLRREAGEMDSLRQAAARTDRAEIDRLEAERREGERRQADRRVGDRREDPLV
jgi:ABC-type multidrug transport system fused ATPase/permease subunit